LGFKFAVEFYGIKEAGIKDEGLNVAFVSLESPLPGFCKRKRFSGFRSWVGLPPRPEMRIQTGPGWRSTSRTPCAVRGNRRCGEM